MSLIGSIILALISSAATYLFGPVALVAVAFVVVRISFSRDFNDKQKIIGIETSLLVSIIFALVVGYTAFHLLNRETLFEFFYHYSEYQQFRLSFSEVLLGENSAFRGIRYSVKLNSIYLAAQVALFVFMVLYFYKFGYIQNLLQEIIGKLGNSGEASAVIGMAIISSLLAVFLFIIYSGILFRSNIFHGSYRGAFIVSFSLQMTLLTSVVAWMLIRRIRH